MRNAVRGHRCTYMFDSINEHVVFILTQKGASRRRRIRPAEPRRLWQPTGNSIEVHWEEWQK